MVQDVRNFAEGLRKRLGITVRCGGCRRKVVYRCEDLRDWISGAADIEALRWRCRWCGAHSHYVRYLVLDGVVAREDIAQWTAPAGRKPPSKPLV